MKSNVSNSVIQQLLTKAQKDGIQKLVVGAVIKRKSKVLLLERVPSDFMGGLVELPSGAVDSNEDLLLALVRETQEETGLTITSVSVYLGSFDYTSSSGKKTRQFNFLVEVKPGDIKLSSTEHQAYYFVSPTDKEYSNLNISDAIKTVIMTL